MSQRRLPWLLALLGVLAIFRWAFPPGGGAAIPASAAVVRMTPAVPAASAPEAVASGVLASTASAEVLDLPGNAFAVRSVAAPPPVPVVAVVNTVIIAPPPPPPVVDVEPPAPPLQVIGTWDDGVARGVFIASAGETLFAKAGTVLQTEYQVGEVTPQYVSIVHVGSKHEWRIPVPQTASNP